MACAAVLLLLAGTQVFETDTSLWPRGVEYSLEKPAAEVRLVVAFKNGLHGTDDEGRLAPGVAAVLVEYNDADRSTCYWNRYRPLPFDAPANPRWSGVADAPGVFVTEGATTELTERTLVLRLPRVNRWRIRLTQLEGNVATLVQAAEARDGKPRAFEELDPEPWEEPAPAVEETGGEEQRAPEEPEALPEEPPPGAEPVVGPVALVSRIARCCRPLPRKRRAADGRGGNTAPRPEPGVVQGAPRPFGKLPSFGAGVVPGAPRAFGRQPFFGAGVALGAPRASGLRPRFGAGVVPAPAPRPLVLPGHPPLR